MLWQLIFVITLIIAVKSHPRTLMLHRLVSASVLPGRNKQLLNSPKVFLRQRKNMSIERLETAARMSKVVKHNGTIYLSGQVAEDPAADITGQTVSMLNRVDALLEMAGSSREHILSATIYLKDINEHFVPMNAVWDAWVPQGNAPARACVQASLAREALLVEISVVAAEK